MKSALGLLVAAGIALLSCIFFGPTGYFWIPFYTGMGCASIGVFLMEAVVHFSPGAASTSTEGADDEMPVSKTRKSIRKNQPRGKE